MNKKERCYYEQYDVCDNAGSDYTGKRCPGATLCERFISENDYFLRSMNGDAPSEERHEDPKEKEARLKSSLSLGKTKKQLKYEAREEAKKNGAGTGYSLKDDPRFKGLFS